MPARPYQPGQVPAAKGLVRRRCSTKGNAAPHRRNPESTSVLHSSRQRHARKLPVKTSDIFEKSLATAPLWKTPVTSDMITLPTACQAPPG